MPTALTKESLRHQIKLKRQQLTLEERHHFSRDAIERFMGNVPLEQGDIIAAYHPMHGELDVTLLPELLQEMHYGVALPCVTDHDMPMVFRHYDITKSLVQNPLCRFMEPSPDAPEVSPSIIIMPLMACDTEGNRLGYGGGFYDRTLTRLAQNSSFLTVGIAYDFQVIRQIPSEEHDYPLDCIVTDKRVIICNEET